MKQTVAELVHIIKLDTMECKSSPSGQYHPINCDFYDHFEIHAMKQNWVQITFKESSNRTPMVTKIKTLKTVQSEEFAILIDESQIRLDTVAELLPIDITSSLLGKILDDLDFNLWANQQILVVLEDQEVSEQICRTVSHNYNALDIWIQRIKGTSSSEYEVWQNRDQDRWPDLFKNAYLQLIEILNNRNLTDVIAYNDLSGKPYVSSLSDIIRHLVNHSTYHRGQVITLLQQDGLSTVSTDFIDYSHLRK